jgi:hypothetical protein
LICCFFIPAVWQAQTVKPTLFPIILWDGCEKKPEVAVTQPNTMSTQSARMKLGKYFVAKSVFPAIAGILAALSCRAATNDFTRTLAQRDARPSETIRSHNSPQANTYPSVPLPPFQLAQGSCQTNWASIASNYSCPEWFRDAKLGFWAHWTPQCVSKDGDWYARNMYVQGSAQYEYNLKHFGHPSRFGFKDLCHLWNADKWDPDQLMDLYQKPGRNTLSRWPITMTTWTAGTRSISHGTASTSGRKKTLSVSGLPRRGNTGCGLASVITTHRAARGASSCRFITAATPTGRSRAFFTTAGWPHGRAVAFDYPESGR